MFLIQTFYFSTTNDTAQMKFDYFYACLLLFFKQEEELLNCYSCFESLKKLDAQVIYL